MGSSGDLVSLFYVGILLACIKSAQQPAMHKIIIKSETCIFLSSFSAFTYADDLVGQNINNIIART